METETITTEAVEEPTEEAVKTDETVTKATEEAATQPTEADGEVKETPGPGFTGDPRDVMELDDFKPVLARRMALIEEQVREDADARVAEQTKDWENTNLHNSLAGTLGNLTEKLEASDIEGAERVVDKLRKLQELYEESYQTKHQGLGANAVKKLLLKAMTGELDIRGQETFHDFTRTATDWVDVVKKFADLKGDKHYQRGLKENREAWEAKQKVEQSKGGGANLVAGKAAGGKSDRERQLDPSTPVSELIEIKARMEAGE